MRPLIALTGPAGSGKDTLAQWLAEHYGYHVEHLSDPLREIAAESAWIPIFDAVYGPSWHKPGFKPRAVLQALGDACRALEPALLVTLLANRSGGMALPIVIADLRHPDEWHACRQRWPKSCLIGCWAPAPVRVARLTARDGLAPDPATLHHATEILAVDLQRCADWVWVNDGPVAVTLAQAASWFQTFFDRSDGQI